MASNSNSGQSLLRAIADEARLPGRIGHPGMSRNVMRITAGLNNIGNNADGIGGALALWFNPNVAAAAP